MLQHYVFIRYAADTPEAHVEEFCRRMRALPARLPDIRHLQIGRDILHDARSWDLMLCMRFESVAALRRYQQHPDHQQVMAFNQPAVAEVGSVDFLLPIDEKSNSAQGSDKFGNGPCRRIG
ncbi:MAG TPA: Dabb family protein [Steroidobacteraceae bacterium]|nr:Dabb family protein [Steroidobacteraceae bacterium]